MADFPQGKPLRVVIVGGSVAGLMHGIVLARLGHRVHVLDRHPAGRALEGRGAGIRTGEHVGAFLRHPRFGDRVGGPLATRNRGVQFLDRDCRMLRWVELETRTTSWGALYYRLRANLDGLQSEYCPETPARGAEDGEVFFDAGTTVTDLKPPTAAGAPVTVVYEDEAGAIGSMPADLIIGADGATSTVRGIVQPEAKRRFASYVAWRGVVPEASASDEARALFADKITYHQLPGRRGHIVLYAIPGPTGAVAPGTRDLNYVWYCNHTAAEIADVMRDADGRPHHVTLPSGKMRPEVFARQQRVAAARLPAPFAELVRKTARPFVQVVTDVAARRAAFWAGRVLLVGDALALFRPHAAASTNQAALNALALARAAEGGEGAGLRAWERECLAYARVTEAASEAWGHWLQYGVAWATLRSGLWYLYVVARYRGFGELWSFLR